MVDIPEQEEMEEERTQLAEKQPKVSCKANRRKQQVQELVDVDMEEDWQTAQDREHTRFCQSCAKSTKENDLIKVCLKCFEKIKQGSL